LAGIKPAVFGGFGLKSPLFKKVKIGSENRYIKK
jgi:hypothetical protein